jgi:DNA-binding CsgD family transcriptional regulator
MDAALQPVEQRRATRRPALRWLRRRTTTTYAEGSRVNGLNAAVINRYAGQDGGGEVISLYRARRQRELAERTDALSERERKVLAEVARGCETEEIAGIMMLSPHTVRSHVKTAMRKLEARTRAHAVAIVLSAGAIEAV